MSLLELYLIADRLRTKRQVMQRLTLFSEPVYSISLNTILGSDKVHRTKNNTDNSKNIEEIKNLDNNHINAFKRAGYFTMYDVKKDNLYNLYSEVDLPKNAIKEIKGISNNNVNIGIDIEQNIEETIEKNEAIKRLKNTSFWRRMFFYEYTILCVFNDKLNNIVEKESAKKDIINNIYDSSKKARYNADIISNIVNASEDYVKDVISGRVEYGLSDKERDQILKRDNYRCQNCGSKNDLEVHHIIPISKGGDKSDENLCTLCFDCHMNIAHRETTSDVNYDTIEEFRDITD